MWVAAGGWWWLALVPTISCHWCRLNVMDVMSQYLPAVDIYNYTPSLCVVYTTHHTTATNCYSTFLNKERLENIFICFLFIVTKMLIFPPHHSLHIS